MKHIYWKNKKFRQYCIIYLKHSLEFFFKLLKNKGAELWYSIQGAELLKLEVKLGKAVKHIKQKAQNKRNWKDKLKQNKSQELKKEGLDCLTKKKKWEEKKIGKMGFWQCGGDFLAGGSSIVRDYKLICYWKRREILDLKIFLSFWSESHVPVRYEFFSRSMIFRPV